MFYEAEDPRVVQTAKEILEIALQDPADFPPRNETPVT